MKEKETSMMQDVRKYFAEMLGTMILVILGCGTAMFASGMSGWLVAVALAFGLALIAVAYTIGSVSGAHINPAVSLAMAIRKKISWKDFIFYVIAQIIGAILGALILFAIVKLAGGADATSNYGSNLYTGLADSVGAQIGIAFIVEIVLTFIFVLTILGVTHKSENKVASGLIIGLALIAVHLFGIALTGTSVNPARSIGPAIFAGAEALKQVWVFILAPLVGGALAAITACCLFKDKEDKQETKPEESHKAVK